MRENPAEPVIGAAGGARVANPVDAGAGERQALDTLYSMAYEELRRLAASIAGEAGRGTLSPTALTNEAWLKLAASPGLQWSSQLHFKRIAARAMRQVLVEAARRRTSAKRGGGEALVTFDEAREEQTADARQLLAIDEALHDLARVSPRQALMVESRFFGGMDIPETAQLLQVSEATVQRDWRAARAWLARELRR